MVAQLVRGRDRMCIWACSIQTSLQRHAFTYLPAHTDFVIFFSPLWEGGGIFTFFGNENLLVPGAK